MQTKENKMGVMPIDKLLISMSLPMMISMLVQALYNIVDSIFVSRINEYALRAVSLAFPIQSLMIAVAVGTAVGINAFLSKTLGEKDFEKADIIAQNGIFLAIASYVAFAVIGLLVSRPFFASQTEVLEVREYGVTYLTICCVAGMGIFLQTTFERLLQATGKTFYTMITQGTGAVINIILDPILIFLASGAGARLCCHVNDSYFWVYTNCMGYDMKTGLKTLSISNVVMSLGGLAATFICSLWL